MIKKIKAYIIGNHTLFYLYVNIYRIFKEFHCRLFSDVSYLKWFYKKNFKSVLDINNPKTYSEKIQVLKLTQTSSIYKIVADKYTVKEYVRDKIGSEYVIPLLWVGNRPKEIPYESLPKSFVIKCTHDSGSVIIVWDKESLDKKLVNTKLSYHLRCNTYLYSRELNYKNMPRRIIVEELITDNLKIPIDYKIYCYYGEPKLIAVCVDRFSVQKNYFYDLQWNLLQFQIQSMPDKEFSLEESQEHSLPKPERLQEMLSICRTLSQGFPYVRLDLYAIKKRVYFGEFTFYPCGGRRKVANDPIDKQMGEWLRLPHGTQKEK